MSWKNPSNNYQNPKHILTVLLLPPFAAAVARVVHLSEARRRDAT
jgi:hypothetical protein